MGGTREMTPADVARILIDSGAIELRPDPADWFTWASGKRAPAYCDNRQLISFPEERRRIASALAESIRTHFPETRVIAGTSTAGIPWAAWVSDLLDVPMVYVRGVAKGHGKQKRVEGRALAGEPTLILEDTISFGGSSISAVEGVQEEGGKVLGVQAIYAWGFEETERAFAEKGVPYRSLTDYATLIETAELTPEASRVLRDWLAR